MHCTYLILVAKQVIVSVVRNVSVLARQHKLCKVFASSFEQAASSVQSIRRGLLLEESYLLQPLPDLFLAEQDNPMSHSCLPKTAFNL